MADTFYGYVRPDGQVGSRNFVAVIPSVTCANDVAQAICRQVQGCIIRDAARCRRTWSGSRTP